MQEILATAAKTLFLIVSTLFPIVDPLAGSPLFLALTPQYSTETRRAFALRVAIYSCCILIGSYFVGARVLSSFGVSLPVVQVGGGLVVTSIGWSMLAQKENPVEPRAA